MTNLEQLIEAGNPNGNTLAEIYANIRDKALEEAANEVYMLCGREDLVRAIRALKRNPNG